MTAGTERGTLVRRVQRAYSYQASNDPRVHFGLADAASVETLEVHFSDGSKEAFGPVDANRYHVLRQGEGRPLP